MGTQQSFSMWLRYSYLICFRSSSLTSWLRMNSHVTEAFPDRKPVTISMFLSLYLLSLSLTSLRSQFLSSSDLLRSRERDLDRSGSLSLLTARWAALSFLYEGMVRQSQFSSLRQLFLLGTILRSLMLFHPAHSAFCYSFYSYYSDISSSRIDFKSPFDYYSYTKRVSMITQEFLRCLTSLAEAVKLTFGKSTKSYDVLVVFLVLGREIFSFEDSSS